MADARAIALKYMSPRYLRLQRLEQYVAGTQYDGRHPFLAQGEDAPPVHERAPCVVYGVAKNAIGSLVDFMMGEGRYPTISAGSSEDDENLDDEWGLNEEDSALLERWANGPLTTCARLRSIFSDALHMAMAGGAVAVVGCVRNGKPELQALPAKWCSPTFDPRTGEVIALEVFYPYIVERFDEIERKWVEKCLLYKRRIDAQADTVYLPGEGREDGLMPSWVEDPSQTAQHALGFCPVRWYAFDRHVPTAEHYDGHALHYHLLDEIDALNMSLSQRHRAALYAGDPQIWETGVEQGENPAPMARYGRVVVEAQAAGLGGQKIGVFTAAPRSAGRGMARMKGPGVVWRYTDAAAKVGILTLPDGALAAIDEHAADLRKKLAEDMSVVLIDPTDVKTLGALSGKSLAFMFARQVARADRIRLDAGDNLILACVDMLLRICLTVHTRQPGSVRVPGMAKVQALLQKLQGEELVVTPDGAPGGTVAIWFGPRLELQWGRYFPPSAEEENFIVTMCAMALEKGLMPLEVILEKLRDVFQFGSTEELVKKLEDERAKKQAEAQQQLEATAQIGAKYAPGTKDGPPFPPSKAGSANGAKGDKKG